MRTKIDMINGKIFPEMIKFSIPILLSGVLQTLYNAADSLVIGRYSSSNALGAVGSAGPMTNIILNLILGFSVGSNVIISRYIGAGNNEKVKKTADTSFLFSIIVGILISAFAVLFSSNFVKIAKIDSEIADMTTLYLKIFFLGLPFSSMYNFCAAILRAKGDTKGPMTALIISGFINVILNVIFVKIFKMGVEGVAIPTVTAQIISAIMVIVMVRKSEIGLRIKKPSFDKKICVDITKIGLPAGLQGMLFSLSNIINVSAVNSFGASAAAANSVVSQVDSVIYVCVSSITQAVITFVSQNIGAGKIKRLKNIFWDGMIITVLMTVILTILSYSFRCRIIDLFAPDDADVLKYSLIKFDYVILPYVLVCLMDIASGMLKGMNATLESLVMSVIGVVGFRITWQLFVFPKFHELSVLYLSYPISWFVTGVAYLIAYLILKRRLNEIDKYSQEIK